MKKKFIGLMTVVAITIIAGYNVYISHSSLKLSDLVLSNVDALASSYEWKDTDCAWVDSDYQFCTPWGNTIGCVCYN